MNNLDIIPQNQKVFIILTGFFLLFIVVELVRRRKMLEQYSAIWIFISLCAVSFIWLYPFILRLTEFIGAGSTTSTILFGGFFALLLLNLQLSVKISEFSHHIKDLIQGLTLLTDKVERLQKRVDELEKPEPTAKPQSKPSAQKR
jgi:hypothetical protein